jgi:hypothetical protein
MATKPNIDAARVSRSSAVWVAAITAIGGFFTAIVTGSFGAFHKSEPTVQRWLRISAVQISDDTSLPNIDRVHLIAQVNGVSYAFPTSTSTLWAAVGPGMASERYPLPIQADSYRVKFFAFGSTPDGKYPRYEHKGVAEFQTRQIPLKNATQTLQLSDSGSKSLAVAMNVRFSID